jgi:type I restriction enzyme S subunit
MTACITFLLKVIQSKFTQDLIWANAKGSAMPHISITKFGKLPLPEQQEIVRRVDALFAFADSVEAKVAAAREKTEKLRQSILAKAFSGQLVETEAEIARREGRDHETAEVLIEKTKEERGKGGKKG